MKKYGTWKVVLSILLGYLLVRNLVNLVNCDVRGGSWDSDFIVFVFSLIDAISIFGVPILILGTVYSIWTKTKSFLVVNVINMIICPFLFLFVLFMVLGDVVALSTNNYGYAPFTLLALIIINLYNLILRSSELKKVVKHCLRCNGNVKSGDKFCGSCGSQL